MSIYRPAAAALVVIIVAKPFLGCAALLGDFTINVDAGDDALIPAGGSDADAGPGGSSRSDAATDAYADVVVVDAGAGHPVDAGADAAAVVDARSEAVADVAPGVDSPPEAACTIPPAVLYHCGTIVTNLMTPMRYCAVIQRNGLGISMPNPAACQCADTITCACLLAQGPPCADAGTYVDCYIASTGAGSTPALVVDCQ